MKGKTVLVCGGRVYNTEEARTHVRNTLDRLNATEGPFECLVHGGAVGADTFAEQWGDDHSIPSKRYHTSDADMEVDPDFWMRQNERMLDENPIDFVVAFPGGIGTAHMVEYAKQAGVRVISIPA